MYELTYLSIQDLESCKHSCQKKKKKLVRGLWPQEHRTADQGSTVGMKDRQPETSKRLASVSAPRGHRIYEAPLVTRYEGCVSQTSSRSPKRAHNIGQALTVVGIGMTMSTSTTWGRCKCVVCACPCTVRDDWVVLTFNNQLKLFEYYAYLLLAFNYSTSSIIVLNRHSEYMKNEMIYKFTFVYTFYEFYMHLYA